MKLLVFSDHLYLIDLQCCWFITAKQLISIYLFSHYQNHNRHLIHFKHLFQMYYSSIFSISNHFRLASTTQVILFEKFIPRVLLILVINYYFLLKQHLNKRMYHYQQKVLNSQNQFTNHHKLEVLLFQKFIMNFPKNFQVRLSLKQLLKMSYPYLLEHFNYYQMHYMENMLFKQNFIRAHHTINLLENKNLNYPHTMCYQSLQIIYHHRMRILHSHHRHLKNQDRQDQLIEVWGQHQDKTFFCIHMLQFSLSLITLPNSVNPQSVNIFL